jgi:hypothetical protein
LPGFERLFAKAEWADVQRALLTQGPDATQAAAFIYLAVAPQQASALIVTPDAARSIDLDSPVLPQDQDLDFRLSQLDQRDVSVTLAKIMERLAGG